ncbi:MAG: Holliday junction resolvase RuvX [Candidatus Cloacimonetes bacterium]|jgi:putative holliday junction resolvase|nr:Holliday junction resolvase RuvX [Candidatus Cloacimonadota bacterium]MBT6994451.1 Holliday junction resolvase RuvX [Candidatus Cloacimonadota bacterium]MBT7470234.1 Holliday junction resolvase RuvX [Candidatus Cloacimonadota bacterium]
MNCQQSLHLMENFRLMGMDYGEVRIGIAISDPLQIFSKPYKVLQNNENDVFGEISEIIEKENVEKIILGLPVNFDGNDTQKTKEVREFAKILQTKIKVPLEFSDERYTSADANDLLKKMGYSPQEGRKHIDKIAAALILKNYLETR